MAAAMGSQAEVGAAAYLPAALNDGQSLTLLRLLGFGPSVAARCRMIESLLGARGAVRSEEHTSELQSLMRLSYAVFCLKKKKTTKEKSVHRHIIKKTKTTTQTLTT